MNEANENVETATHPFKSPTDDFEYLKFLGKGAYGNVFKVRKLHGKDEKKIYAIKSVCKYSIVKKNRKSAIDHIVTEFNILKSIKHPFLVELMYAFQEKTEIYFVMEFLSGGTLDDLLMKRTFLCEPTASFYMKELILAIEHLHSKNIIHRDVKPQNVLLDSKGHVKLADYGLSKDGIHDWELTRTICGSPVYMAPEIRNKGGYGKGVDWWALGVLFYKLVVGYPPFTGWDKGSLNFHIALGIFRIPKRISLKAQDLIAALLNTDPDVRLGSFGVDEIKNHPFFAKTSWDNVLQRLEKPPFVPRIREIELCDWDSSSEHSPESEVMEALNARNNDVFKEFNFVNPELK